MGDGHDRRGRTVRSAAKRCLRPPSEPRRTTQTQCRSVRVTLSLSLTPTARSRPRPRRLGPIRRIRPGCATHALPAAGERVHPDEPPPHHARPLSSRSSHCSGDIARISGWLIGTRRNAIGAGCGARRKIDVVTAIFVRRSAESQRGHVAARRRTSRRRVSTSLRRRASMVWRRAHVTPATCLSVRRACAIAQMTCARRNSTWPPRNSYSRLDNRRGGQ